MSAKRKAGNDDEPAELKRALDEVKRLKQELQELKEKDAKVNVDHFPRFEFCSCAQ
jgi:hypothetical protein